MYQLAEASPTAPVPPQNLDAEESVLGAMMLSPGAIGAVSEVLSASDFYRASHAAIYKAALDLYAKGEPVDAITLADELERRGELEEIGGRARINELAALVPASSNAGHYARIVREMATLRGLVRAGQEIARLGFEREGLAAEELVDRAESVIFDLSQERVAGEFTHIEELLKDSFERITALYEAGADVTGMASGFKELDRLTSGFQPGNLIVIAARPIDGQVGVRALRRGEPRGPAGVPVAMFTLEMSKLEVTQRLMCSEAKVESQRLRTGKLAQEDWPRLTAACDKLAKAPIYVDDTGSITLMEIRSKARRLKMREPNLGLIIIDYLQLMTSGVSRREPGAGGLADLALAEGAGARPRRPDHRDLAALPRGRAAPRQAADPLRPARVRVDRAGRRPGRLHLPRRVLQRRGVRPAGPRRSPPGEAPERPHGHGEALVPAPLREVHRHGTVLMSNIDDHQIIWLGADATTYAVPCERCREEHRFADVIECDGRGDAAAGGRRRLHRLPPRPPDSRAAHHAARAVAAR